jgi:spore protease
MLNRRTDLAIEAKELWMEAAAEQTKLEGVEARDETQEGFAVNVVKVLNETGANAIGKPPGTYITVNLEGLQKREDDAFGRAARAIAAELKPLLNLRTRRPCWWRGWETGTSRRTRWGRTP